MLHINPPNTPHDCPYVGEICEMAADIKAIRKAVFEGNGQPGIMTRLLILERSISTGNQWVDRLLSWLVAPVLTAGVLWLILGIK